MIDYKICSLFSPNSSSFRDFIILFDCVIAYEQFIGVCGDYAILELIGVNWNHTTSIKGTWGNTEEKYKAWHHKPRRRGTLNFDGQGGAIKVLSVVALEHFYQRVVLSPARSLPYFPNILHLFFPIFYTFFMHFEFPNISSSFGMWMGG